MHLLYVLLNLPSDVTGVQVLSNMDLKSLAKLDCACAARDNRQRLRALFSLTSIVLAPCPSLKCLEQILSLGLRVLRVDINEKHVGALNMIVNSGNYPPNIRLSYHLYEKEEPCDSIENIISQVADNVTSVDLCQDREWHVFEDLHYVDILLSLAPLHCLTTFICRCSAASEPKIAQLILNNPQLCNLRINLTCSLSPHMHAAMKAGAAALLEVRLDNLICLMDADIALLAESCPAVQRLWISAQSSHSNRDSSEYDVLSSDDGVAAIANSCPELRELTLRGIAPSEASLVQVVICCDKLYKLDALDAVLTDSVLLALVHADSWGKMRRLTVTGCKKDVVSLAVTWAVKRIDTITRCATFFEQLESLSVYRSYRPAEEDGHIRADLVTEATLSSAVAACTQLHTLQVDDPSYHHHADVLAAVAQGCLKLRRLVVLSSIGEDCIAAVNAIVEKCRWLEELTLREEDNVMTDQLLNKIAICLPRLRQLECCGQKVTSRGFAQLGRCPQLRCVSMVACVEVYSAGLAALAQGCYLLESLTMPDCGFSEKSVLQFLASCKHLTYLHLRDGSLSARTMQRLFHQRRGLNVEFTSHFEK